MNIFKKLFHKGLTPNIKTCIIDNTEYQDIEEEKKPFIDDDEYYDTLSAIDYLIKKFNIKDNSTGFFTWLSCKVKLNPESVAKYKDLIDWAAFSQHQKLSENGIRLYKDKVDWDAICTHQKLSEYFIKEFQDYVNWDIISSTQIFSEYFMKDFIHKINWHNALRHQQISEEFLRYLIDTLGLDKIDLTSILYASNLNMSAKFLEDFKYNIDWKNIPSYAYNKWDSNIDNYLFTEEFVKELLDETDDKLLSLPSWKELSSTSRWWSIDFLREFKDKLDWEYASRNVDDRFPTWKCREENSECIADLYNFLEEFEDYLDWEMIAWQYNDILPLEFLSKYSNKISFRKFARCSEMEDIIDFMEEE